MESRAQCCSAWPVGGGGCADRRHALVPVGCTGQPGPARCCVSLRTLARRAVGPGGGGCPASPGRGACGLSPGGTGLGPVAPVGLFGSWCDDRACFEVVDHGRDDHLSGGTIRDGLRLVGQAACRDTAPRPVVAVALPAAAVTVGADGPFPAHGGGPVGCFAVP